MSKTIFERVYDAVVTLNIPFAAGKYIVATGSDYPETFITFSLVSSPAEQFADNAETMRSYRVQVNIFSRGGLINLPDDQATTAKNIYLNPIRPHRVQVNIFSRGGLINLPDVDGAMTAAGFTKGNMVEIPPNAETGHFGLATDFHFLESEE